MITYKDELWLFHHGVKGQRWGVRRYQNDDGSLTEAGRKRYYGSEKRFEKAVKSDVRKSRRKSISSAIENRTELGKIAISRMQEPTKRQLLEAYKKEELHRSDAIAFLNKKVPKDLYDDPDYRDATIFAASWERMRSSDLGLRDRDYAAYVKKWQNMYAANRKWNGIIEDDVRSQYASKLVQKELASGMKSALEKWYMAEEARRASDLDKLKKG